MEGTGCFLLMAGNWHPTFTPSGIKAWGAWLDLGPKWGWRRNEMAWGPSYFSALLSLQRKLTRAARGHELMQRWLTYTPAELQHQNPCSTAVSCTQQKSPPPQQQQQHAAHSAPARVHRRKSGFFFEISHGTEPIYLTMQFNMLFFPGLVWERHPQHNPIPILLGQWRPFLSPKQKLTHPDLSWVVGCTCLQQQ